MKIFILLFFLVSCGTKEKETVKEVEVKEKEKQEAVEEAEVTEEENVTINTLTKDIQPVVERIEIIENEPAVAYDNVWRDPVTDDYWLLGEFGDFDNVADTCSGDWSVPIRTDLLTAVYRGLLQALQLYHGNQAVQTVWSGEEITATPTYGWHVELNPTIPQIMSDLKTDVKFIVCVNKNEG